MDWASLQVSIQEVRTRFRTSSGHRGICEEIRGRSHRQRIGRSTEKPFGRAPTSGHSKLVNGALSIERGRSASVTQEPTPRRQRNKTRRTKVRMTHESSLASAAPPCDRDLVCAILKSCMCDRGAADHGAARLDSLCKT